MKKFGMIILSAGLMLGTISFSALACSPGPDNLSGRDFTQPPPYRQYQTNDLAVNHRFNAPWQPMDQPGSPVCQDHRQDKRNVFVNQPQQAFPYFGRSNYQPIRSEMDGAPFNHRFEAPRPYQGQPCHPAEPNVPWIGNQLQQAIRQIIPF